MLKLGYGWLADPDSPFVFAKVEMRRFNVPEKLEQLRGIAAGRTIQ
jgi:hypothetical protein